MKPSVHFLLLLFVSNYCCAQINRDSIKSAGYFAGTKATIETGIHYPVGHLANILKTNMMFGFSIDIPTTNNPAKLIGLNAIILLTNNSKPFSYKLKDSFLSTKIIKTGFVGGVHYTNRKYISEKYILDKLVGVGFGLLSTSLEKKNFENKNDKHYSLSAFNLNAGISLKRAISKNTRMGLRLLYNFTSYALFNKQIPKDFGTSNLVTSLSFTF